MKKLVITILTVGCFSSIAMAGICLKIINPISAKSELENSTHIYLEQNGYDIKFRFLEYTGEDTLSVEVLNTIWLHDKYQVPVGETSNYLWVWGEKKYEKILDISANGKRVRNVDDILGYSSGSKKASAPILKSLSDSTEYKTIITKQHFCE